MSAETPVRLAPPSPALPWRRNVADALAAAVARSGANNVAIRGPKVHRITRDDLMLLERGMVRLDLDGPARS